MVKKHIAVVMGGYSSEFEISLLSGDVVCESLDANAYNVYRIHILKSGWCYLANDGTKYPINKSDFSFNTANGIVKPDAIFNTVHGTPGEDGLLQAYWELLEIPQSSPNFYPAALSFNKRDCLSVLKNFGIKCANSYSINKGSNFSSEEIIKKVGLPCFVKPNRAGSSFGISKVYDIDKLLPAIDIAFEEDSEIIIETALVGTEVSVGSYQRNGELIVLSPTEIVTDNDFFDFEAKYLGKSQEITPARISEEETIVVQNKTKDIYRILNMCGITRCDFIIQDGEPYFIEINATPGLSKESIVPKQALEAGLTLTEFFGDIIEELFR